MHALFSPQCPCAQRETIREACGDLLMDEREDFEDWSVPKPEELEGVATERERAGVALGRPCYRACFRKPA